MQSLILADGNHEEYDRTVGYEFLLSKSMPLMRFPVAVIMQRIPLVNPWSDERWEAVAVEVAEAVDRGSEACRRRRGRYVLALPGLFRRAASGPRAEGYYLNASATEPKVFVLWRMAEEDDAAEPRARPLIVTLSYGEAARFLDVGEQVDAVPIPGVLLAALQSFVAAHCRPEPRKKVKRNELYEGDEARRREAGGGRGR